MTDFDRTNLPQTLDQPSLFLSVYFSYLVMIVVMVVMVMVVMVVVLSGTRNKFHSSPGN